MSFEFQDGFHPSWVEAIIALHNRTPLKRSPDDKEKLIRAYTNRYAVLTCWQSERLVGIGTLISDGELYATIFDVVVDPDFQGQGLGREIVERLIKKVAHTCIHLTSTFGNEDFYRKLGFRRHKTAFAKYPWNSEYLE